MKKKIEDHRADKSGFPCSKKKEREVRAEFVLLSNDNAFILF